MMRVPSRDPTLFLLDPQDIKQDLLPLHLKDYKTHFETIINWAHDYLCQSHQSLGREGPVCPYTQPSLDYALLWLTAYPNPRPTLFEISDVMTKYQEWFLELKPTTGKEAQYKAILVLFPELAPAPAPNNIDTIQLFLKSDFIAKGLMIGQFHSNCEEPALWNHDFQPFRSPVPLLAIRHMVPTDFPFLKKEAGWLAAYLQRFEYAVPSRYHTAVHEAAINFGLAYPDP